LPSDFPRSAAAAETRPAHFFRLTADKQTGDQQPAEENTFVRSFICFAGAGERHGQQSERAAGGGSGLEAAREPVADCDDGGAGGVYGGAGHLDRQRGAAAHRRVSGRVHG